MDGGKLLAARDQSQVLKLVKDSPGNFNCCLVTGPAGTGKSTMLQAVRSHFKGRAAVLAPMGMAAMNINGQTIHSFFKFPPRFLHKNPDDVKQFAKGSERRMAIEQLDVLIIDEISMVRVDVLEAIEHSLRINTGVDLPFGGKKVVFFGDMFQLEPVIADTTVQSFIEASWRSHFFFDSSVWAEEQLRVLFLTTVHRQGSDQAYRDALHNLRKGDTSTLGLFNGNVSKRMDQSVLVLATTKRGAQNINGGLSPLTGQ